MSGREKLGMSKEVVVLIWVGRHQALRKLPMRVMEDHKWEGSQLKSRGECRKHMRVWEK